MKIKRLAIIPARQGSKRVRNKNIRVFHGKPIINYSITTAIRSNLFEKIHVSTNCSETIKIVEDFGLSVDFERPSVLAQDSTPLLPVLQYVATEYEKREYIFDEIWLIMACAPLLDAKELSEASRKFRDFQIGKNKEVGTLLAVAEFPAPVEWALRKRDDGLISPINQVETNKSSQEMETFYYDTGAFMAFTRDALLNPTKNTSQNQYIPYVIPPYKAVDIDTENDWKLAEELYEKTR